MTKKTHSEHIEQKLAVLPSLPGCYLMKDKDGEIIYVGKAKNLRNRVRSYFRGAHDQKTTKLVSEIVDFDTIVVNNNKEALILEINLIQEYQPQYNIKLKESGMYPYIKITNEKDPQLLITSHVSDDGAIYFGPFPNVNAATNTQQVLQRAYPLRRCGRNEKRACFYYHLGQCLGPCKGEVSQEAYQENIDKIKRFFNGDVQEIKDELTRRMQKASDNLDFEQAADYRDQLNYIKTTIEKQNVMSSDYDNIDVFAYSLDRGFLSVQVFMLRQGSILEREAAIYPIYGEAEDELTSFIARFYKEEGHLKPNSILVPFDTDHEVLEEILKIEVTTPIRGQKKRLLEMCEKNSRLALEEKFRLIEMNDRKTKGAVTELKELLNIDDASYIEAFDHSHIFGSHAISGMVVYKDGKEAKDMYRKFKIKTVDHADEYAYTQEVIRRRYIRLLKEDKELPSLILMDGGIVQVRAAKDILENELGLDIPVAGMVKDDKHKTASLLDGETEEYVDIDPNSYAFHLLQRIQEEVHQYAISYHRNVRSKATLGSYLDEIKGVGPKTRKKLLKHFRSLDKIADASLEEFRLLGIPKPTAENIKEALVEFKKE